MLTILRGISYPEIGAKVQVHTIAPQHLHEVLCIQSTTVLLERVPKWGEVGIPNSKLQKDSTVYLANSWLDMFSLE